MTLVASHVETTSRKLDHVHCYHFHCLAKFNEESHVYVTWTQFLMYLAFALHTDSLFTLDSSVCFAADIFKADESRAVSISAISWVERHELPHHEVDFFSVLLRNNLAADIERSKNLPALGKKGADAVESHSEGIKEAVPTIAVSYVFTLKCQGVYGRYTVNTCLPKFEVRF